MDDQSKNIYTDRYGITYLLLDKRGVSRRMRKKNNMSFNALSQVLMSFWIKVVSQFLPGFSNHNLINEVKISKLTLIGYTTAIVGLNLMAAVAMKLLARFENLSNVIILFGIGAIILLNVLRLLVWLLANKLFPLSTIYPLTSIFYPLMLGISYFFNENISYLHIIGTLLITFGVFWLGWKIRDATNE